jgi:hypothetical protein
MSHRDRDQLSALPHYHVSASFKKGCCHRPGPQVRNLEITADEKPVMQSCVKRGGAIRDVPESYQMPLEQCFVTNAIYDA